MFSHVAGAPNTIGATLITMPNTKRVSGTVQRLSLSLSISVGK